MTAKKKPARKPKAAKPLRMWAIYNMGRFWAGVYRTRADANAWGEHQCGVVRWGRHKENLTMTIERVEVRR